MSEFLEGPELVGVIFVVLALWRLTARLWRRGPLAALRGRPRVIDGDTLIVRGERVRIAGIDAPEQKQRFRGQTFRRGPGVLATAALRRVIGRRRVEVVPIKRDRYGRLLARVRAGDDDAGGEMIARGYAPAHGTGDRRYRGGLFRGRRI